MAFVNERTGLLNLWFDQPHWGFNWEKMTFVRSVIQKNADDKQKLYYRYNDKGRKL